MTIELRLSDVDPPAAEPKRTIYRDIVNLPDPVKLGITIRYFNHDDVDLYFQITGSGTGYTFGTVNLGLLASGANAYQNLDEFASKTKPSTGDLPNGEMEENITLTLKAYTDSGYTNLKWTYERVVTVHWINSADPAFTVDVLNNFDDGTVQGWAAVNEAGNSAGYPTLAVATDYVLSPQYSLKMAQTNTTSGGIELRARIYKSFTTPNKSKVYAIFDIRANVSSAAQVFIQYITINEDTTILVFLGRPYVGAGTQFLPLAKWIRCVVPLPSNTTLELRVVQDWNLNSPTYVGYLWMDDFKILSK